MDNWEKIMTDYDLYYETAVITGNLTNENRAINVWIFKRDSVTFQAHAGDTTTPQSEPKILISSWIASNNVFADHFELNDVKLQLIHPVFGQKLVHVKLCKIYKNHWENNLVVKITNNEHLNQHKNIGDKL